MASEVEERSATYLRLCVICIVAATVGSLMSMPSGLDSLMAVVGVLGALVFGIAWLRVRRRRDEPPDMLAELVGGYYERDGLCFAPHLQVSGDLCWFTVYCQNCYSERIVGQISFLPLEGMSTAGAHDVPPITVDVNIEGGDVSAVSVPYPIARAWQGKLVVYNVVAKATHPLGRGRVIRSGQGSPVGEPTRQLSMGEQVVQAVREHLIPLSGLRLTPGAFEARLPEDVSDHVQEMTARRELLYRWKNALRESDDTAHRNPA